MIIRPITLADVSDAAHILLENFPFEIDVCLADLRHGIDDWKAGNYGYCEQIVAEMDGVIVGISGCYRLETTPAEFCGINWMAVAEEHQRLGIGRALLAAVEQIAARNHRMMFVYADFPAIGFYKKCGYTENGLGLPSIEWTKILSKPLIYRGLPLETEKEAA